MNSNQTQPKSRDFLNLIPGAASALLCEKLARNFHGTALASAVVVGLSMLVGFAVAVAMCALLRAYLSKVTSSRSLSVVLSLVISLGLAIVLFTISVAMSDSGPGSTFASSVPTAEDTQVRVFTVRQNANGATEADITEGVLQRWTDALAKQAKQNMNHVCLKNGGNETICSEFKISESHKIVQHAGHKVVILRSRISNGNIVMRTDRIMALEGADFVSVGCMTMADIPISLVIGPCAKEMKMSLGFIKVDPFVKTVFA
ncbi:MAG: hypothetical protein ACRD22_16065 [Terriglobia bacterium]